MSRFIVAQIILVAVGTFLAYGQNSSGAPNFKAEGSDTDLKQLSGKAPKGHPKRKEELPPLDNVGCVFNVRDTSIGSPANNLKYFNFEYCTDIYYYEAILDEDSLRVKNLLPGEIRPERSFGFNPLYLKFNEIKDLDSHGLVHTLLIVGQKDSKSKAFETVAQNEDKTRTFIWSAVKILRFWGFNGLVINWRYTDPQNRKLYTRLISRIREEFEKEDLLTDLERLRIIAIVGANTWDIRHLYDVKELNNLVDQFEIDAASDLDINYKRTAIVNALYITDNGTRLSTNATGSTSYSDQLDPLEARLKEWVWLGANASNIDVIFSLAGTAYELADVSKNGIWAPALGPYEDPTALTTNQSGILPFNELCRMVETGGNLKRLSSRDKTPYWYNGQVWVNFEDEVSLEQKVKYLMRNNIGGAIIWFQYQDDFQGSSCSHGALPMTKLLYNVSKAARSHRSHAAYIQLVCHLSSGEAAAPSWILFVSASLSALWVMSGRVR